MIFTHQALLWLLPLAALPLLLHLLTLHRLKTVELSTFRFLFDSYVQQRRRMQFLEALLAILRFLFLAFLVFMFTRPVVSHWGALFGADGAGGREVVLLVDCSASMTARSGGTAALDRAKAAAVQVVKRLRKDDRLTLVRLAGQPEEIFSRFPTDTKDIEGRILDLKPTSSRVNMLQALQYLFGPEATKRHNPAVYLFTDGQATAWRELQKKKDELVPPQTPFWVVTVGVPDAQPNVAVIGDAPRRNRAVVGLPFVLRPRVVNFSKTETVEATLSVFIDDKEIARTPLVLKPGEAVTRQVIHVPREPGVQRGRFEVTPRQPDRFPDDNRFLFTLAVVPRVKVVLINGGPNPDPSEDEARFLATALTTSPDSSAEPRTGPLAASRDFLRSVEVREINEPALTAEVLREASVVLLANCGGLAEAQYGLLRNFVSNGGGLLVLPGDRVEKKIDEYNTKFFPVPGPQGERLTAVTLGTAEGDPNRSETFETFEVHDFSHPALTVFDNPDPEKKHFKTARVYRHFKLQMPTKPGRDPEPAKAPAPAPAPSSAPAPNPRPPVGGTAWPLAWLGSGSPALVESRLGDGIVILSAFPMHTRWTNLPTKPDFVPLVLRLASHVEHRGEVEVPAVVAADGIVEVVVSSGWGRITGTVKDPSGHLTRLQSFERTGTRQSQTFDHTAERGYYAVEVKNDRADNPRTATLAFAVNLAPEESDFTPATEKQLREYLARGDVTIIDASAEAQALKGPIGKGNEVWRYLIWALFLIIGAEFLLATLAGGRREGEEGGAVSERLSRLSPGSWVSRMTGGGRKP